MRFQFLCHAEGHSIDSGFRGVIEKIFQVSVFEPGGDVNDQPAVLCEYRWHCQSGCLKRSANPSRKHSVPVSKRLFPEWRGEAFAFVMFIAAPCGIDQ